MFYVLFVTIMLFSECFRWRCTVLEFDDDDNVTPAFTRQKQLHDVLATLLSALWFHLGRTDRLQTVIAHLVSNSFSRLQFIRHHLLGLFNLFFTRLLQTVILRVCRASVRSNTCFVNVNHSRHLTATLQCERHVQIRLVLHNLWLTFTSPAHRHARL